MPSSREVRWLHRELPALVERGVVSVDTADRLRAHYGPVTSRPTTSVLFGALGAAMIGGGVALLIAHNWQDLSRGGRAVLTLTLLLGAQAVAGFTALRRWDSSAWREGSVVFLMFMVAAAIALIGQTYHFPGDPRAFIGTCLLLSVPLVYLFDSRLGAGLFLGALSIWPMVDRLEAGDRLQYLAYAALIIPYLASLRRTPVLDRHAADSPFALNSLGGSAVIALGVGVVHVVSVGPASLAACVWAALAASLYGAGTDAEVEHEIPGYAPAARAFGSLAIAGATAMLCFGEAWGFVDESLDAGATTGDYVAYGLVGLAILGIWGGRVLRFSGPWHRRLALALPVVVAVGVGAELAIGGGVASVLLFSAYGLAVGIGALLSGIERESIRSANSGLALVIAVLAVRFADVEWSFVVRGLGFIALGIMFLTVNTRLLRARNSGESSTKEKP